MTGARPPHAASIGVVEQGNRVALVTVAPDARVLDRREVALTGSGVPTHPHHHEGSWAVGRYLRTPGARPLPLSEAVALVERVRASAARGARESLDALARALPVPVATIAVRACPPLPPTIEERITDHRAQAVADSAMYREAVAEAARERGWAVHWYERDRVFDAAAAALGVDDVDDVEALLQRMGRSVGPPWRAAHRLAAAAALAAGGRQAPGSAHGVGIGRRAPPPGG